MVGGQRTIQAILLPGRRHVTHYIGEMTQHYNSNLRKLLLNNSQRREIISYKLDIRKKSQYD